MAQKTAMKYVLSLVEQMFNNADALKLELPASLLNDIINIITQEGIPMEKDQLKQEFIQGYNLGYEDSQCNHINDGETLSQEREYLKESTCEYSGLRSVQSYEDPKK